MTRVQSDPGLCRDQRDAPRDMCSRALLRRFCKSGSKANTCWGHDSFQEESLLPGATALTTPWLLWTPVRFTVSINFEWLFPYLRISAYKESLLPKNKVRIQISKSFVARIHHVIWALTPWWPPYTHTYTHTHTHTHRDLIQKWVARKGGKCMELLFLLTWMAAEASAFRADGKIWFLTQI